MNVLVVCSGNICRSPMAAEYLRHLARKNGVTGLVVESAGMLDIRDRPASAEAVEALREIGLDLSAHRSRGVTSGRVDRADVVIVMERAHLSDLSARFPLHPRCFLLSAFRVGSDPAPDAPDTPDPIGELGSGFEKIASGDIESRTDLTVGES